MGKSKDLATGETRFVNTAGDTMTGDLTIDTNTFHVDVADNRVGIGTTSPAQTFHVNGGAANVVAKFESTDAFAAAMFTDDTGSAEIAANGNDVVLMPAGTERFRVLNDGRFKSGEISYAYFTGTIHSSETRWYKLVNYASGYMMDGTAQLSHNRNGGFNQTGAHRNYNFAIGGYSNAIYGPFNVSGDTGEGGNGTLHIGSDENVYLRTVPSNYGGTVIGLIIGRLRSWDYDGTYVTSAP